MELEHKTKSAFIIALFEAKVCVTCNRFDLHLVEVSLLHVVLNQTAAVYAFLASPALPCQEAETFGFSRVVVPFTRKNRSAGPKGGRGRGAGRDTTASAKAPAAKAGEGGRRGSIEVLECRYVVRHALSLSSGRREGWLFALLSFTAD